MNPGEVTGAMKFTCCHGELGNEEEDTANLANPANFEDDPMQEAEILCLLILNDSLDSLNSRCLNSDDLRKNALCSIRQNKLHRSLVCQRATNEASSGGLRSAEAHQ